MVDISIATVARDFYNNNGKSLDLKIWFDFLFDTIKNDKTFSCYRRTNVFS